MIEGEKMKKIAIISDTHDVLRNEVIKELNTCDLIFHAGDFVKEEIYQQLQKIAPIIAVKGNNDKFDLPEELNCEIAGHKFYLTHQKKDVQNVDFYIFGHSHRYLEQKIDNTHYLNPGSCGRRRFSLPLTYMILYIDKNNYYVVRREIKR